MSLLSLILGFCIIYLKLLSQADEKRKKKLEKKETKARKKRKEGQRKEGREEEIKRKEERKQYFQFLGFLDSLG